MPCFHTGAQVSNLGPQAYAATTLTQGAISLALLLYTPKVSGMQQDNKKLCTINLEPPPSRHWKTKCSPQLLTAS